MKITVKNIAAANSFMAAAMRIVPDGKFIFSKGSCNLKMINESQTIRAFLSTDAMAADEDGEFSFQDISKLHKSIGLIAAVEDKTSTDIEFDGAFVKYKADVNFKLRTVKPEIIERYVTNDITAKLEEVYSFTTSSDLIKRALQCTAIVNDADSKVYFSKSGKKVVAEIDDKKNKLANNIAVPIAHDMEGNLTEVVAITLDNFKSFNLIPADKINVSYTDKKVFVIKSEQEVESCKIQLYLISTTIKG